MRVLLPLFTVAAVALGAVIRKDGDQSVPLPDGADAGADYLLQVYDGENFTGTSWAALPNPNLPSAPTDSHQTCYFLEPGKISSIKLLERPNKRKFSCRFFRTLDACKHNVPALTMNVPEQKASLGPELDNQINSVLCWWKSGPLEESVAKLEVIEPTSALPNGEKSDLPEVAPDAQAQFPAQDPLWMFQEPNYQGNIYVTAPLSEHPKCLYGWPVSVRSLKYLWGTPGVDYSCRFYPTLEDCKSYSPNYFWYTESREDLLQQRDKIKAVICYPGKIANPPKTRREISSSEAFDVRGAPHLIDLSSEPDFQGRTDYNYYPDMLLKTCKSTGGGNQVHDLRNNKDKNDRPCDNRVKSYQCYVGTIRGQNAEKYAASVEPGVAKRSEQTAYPIELFSDYNLTGRRQFYLWGQLGLLERGGCPIFASGISSIRVNNYPQHHEYFRCHAYATPNCTGTELVFEDNILDLRNITEQGWDDNILSMGCSNKTVPPSEAGVNTRGVNEALQDLEGTVNADAFHAIDLFSEPNLQGKNYYIDGPDEPGPQARCWTLPSDASISSVKLHKTSPSGDSYVCTVFQSANCTEDSDKVDSIWQVSAGPEEQPDLKDGAGQDSKQNWDDKIASFNCILGQIATPIPNPPAETGAQRISARDEPEVLQAHVVEEGDLRWPEFAPIELFRYGFFGGRRHWISEEDSRKGGCWNLESDANVHSIKILQVYPNGDKYSCRVYTRQDCLGYEWEAREHIWWGDLNFAGPDSRHNWSGRILSFQCF